MNRHQKKVLSIAAAIANLSFSIVVTSVATYAWFAERNRVDGVGVSIKAATTDIILDYQVLKYDDDKKKGIIAYDNDNEKWEFVLPKYDEYIKERNKYSNIIVRAEMTFGYDVNTSNTEIDIDISKLTTSVLKGNDGINYLTSNVCQFKCIATSYTVATTQTVVPIGVGILESKPQNDDTYKDDVDAQYKSATTYFATRKTPSTFISLVNGQPVDPQNGNTIRVIPELYNVGLIRKAVVYIECSYNEQLATGFVNDHPDASLHDLAGDIDKIVFSLRNISNEKYGETNTGQYIKMNSVGQSYDGKYLPAHLGNESNQEVLDGLKTTGSETVGTSSGINSSDNQLNVSSYIGTSQNTIYASDRIDDASFAFNRSKGTYQSENGHYIGNDTTTEGIVSNSSYTNLRNNLSYDGYNASITSMAQNTMKMQYSNSKFAYSSASQNNINLYRFHENDMISATLQSIVVNQPTSPNDSYSVGEYFELTGVSVIATYKRTGSEDTFTINVTSLCTYTTSNEGTLIPDQTTFTHMGNPKTINVTYVDGNVTCNGSYTLTVIADVLQSIEITSNPTKQFYRKGDIFEITGLCVMGNFAATGQHEVTGECSFTINGVAHLPGQTAVTYVGNNVSVIVHFNSTSATIGPNYEDQEYKITIKDTFINIIEESESIAIGGSFTVTFAYNANVSWSITNSTGVLSFSSSSTITTESTTYSGANYANATDTITVYGITGGTATLTASVPGGNSDSCTFSIIDTSQGTATYVITSTSAVTATGAPVGSSATYSSTYNSKCQLTKDNSMTLILRGYDGYKINRITLSMKSNQNGGSGTFSTVIGSTTISEINPAAAFSSASWNGAYTTSYVDVIPAISIANNRVVGDEELVTITIAATANSLYCQSYTIDYAVDRKVSTLDIYDGQTLITSGQKVISQGNVGLQWSPTALITYTNLATSSFVSWEVVSGDNTISINKSTGQITLKSVSGEKVIRATTIETNTDGSVVTAQFTLRWSNLTKILDHLEIDEQIDTYNVGDPFVKPTVSAHYNDGSSNVINSDDISVTGTYDMDTEGSYTVTLGYGGKTIDYSFSVSSQQVVNYALVYTLDGTITGSGSSYTADNEITQNDIDWTVNGNTQMNPWRIGGKSITNADRNVKTTETLTAEDIAKVEVSIGTASSITLNSITLKVGTTEGGSDIASIAKISDLNANSTIVFEKAGNTSWANRYFTITFNVTVSGSSNKFVQLNNIKFYKIAT